MKKLPCILALALLLAVTSFAERRPAVDYNTPLSGYHDGNGNSSNCYASEPFKDISEVKELDCYLMKKEDGFERPKNKKPYKRIKYNRENKKSSETRGE